MLNQAASHLQFATDTGQVRTVLVVVLDSLRWDSFQEARTPVIDEVCSFTEQRMSYASWTLPSHSCLFSGLLPWRPEPGRAAAATYRDDFLFWSHLLTGDGKHAGNFHPTMSLAGMAEECGWSAHARVSMPVLRPEAGLRHGFPDYVLSPQGSGLGAQVSSIRLADDRPNLVFINAAETHYPFMLPKSRLPRLPGAHGVAGRDLAAGSTGPSDGYLLTFSDDDYLEMKAAQIRAVEVADRRLGAVIEQLPKPLAVVVTADHGELFGEDGMFGHGPYFHPALFQVPLTMGVVS
ncbi:hypothetical protein OG782_28720 [Streptomyces sp. NBC_00876]|uniref:hypothetical protein n=1 Tax=Streptomyces sp. NBC_00876 TaxID=2975853 RepID=UPI0038689395|nr:hypothetical protein OG782_28720 [Streptomyces sp. NBC_00876]